MRVADVVDLQAVSGQGVGGGDPGMDAQGDVGVADVLTVVGEFHDFVGGSEELDRYRASPGGEAGLGRR